MPTRKGRPPMGRPLTEGEPLTVRVCGYFPESERNELEALAAELSAEESRLVTVAEVIRRSAREYLRLRRR